MKKTSQTHKEINGKSLILSTILLFLMGSMLHFSYEFSGQNKVVGLFSAVNESIWEHSKMVLLPILLWWIIYYIIKRKQFNIDINAWFLGSLVSLLTALIVMPACFYFYTQALGVEFLLVDIFILFLSLLCGQSLGLHFYQHGIRIPVLLSISIWTAIVLMYFYFTFYPPHLPWFMDGNTGQYGFIA